MTDPRTRSPSRWTSLMLAVLLAVPVACSHIGSSSGGAPAEPKAWNDAHVASLAHDLARETAELQTGLGRHLEDSPVGSPRRIVLHDVYEIHHRAVSLESGLRAGLGRAGTEPVFRRLLDGVRNARRDAAAFPEIEALRHRIDAANVVLRELEAYYGIAE